MSPPLDRLARIQADTEVGFRPSLGDTRWLITQVQILRARLEDAQEDGGRAR